MIVDELELIIKAGHGGKGKVSFHKRSLKAGPDGGNGGAGGDVYILSTSDLTALNRFKNRSTVSGQDGKDGGSNRKSGKDGQDLELILPIGTSLKDIEIGKVIELNESGEKIIICKGGLGGRGNFELKSSRRTTPEYAQPGLPGETKAFEITLKFIADFGLIGLPNSGKTSLLNALTKANAKVGDYPFTTLEPNLGVLNDKIIADVPGLIEGASHGKGLGIKFLKHIEKVDMLLHCISVESEDIAGDYKAVRQELKNYNKNLRDKKEFILLTKIDLIGEKLLKDKIKVLSSLSKSVYPISINQLSSIQSLKKVLIK